MSDLEMAAFLQCREAALRDLALCRRPATSSPAFRSDVERIASYVGLDAARLAQILREVEAAAALRAATVRSEQGVRGLLLAARDRGKAVNAQALRKVRKRRKVEKHLDNDAQ